MDVSENDTFGVIAGRIINQDNFFFNIIDQRTAFILSKIR